MDAAKILKGGLTGAATLTLLTKALDGLNLPASDGNLFHKKGIVRNIKKHVKKKGFKAVKVYVRLAAELLSSAGVLGLSKLGKKKNVILKGGLLGALSGTAVAFLQNNDEEATDNKELWRKRLVTIALYVVGGLIAGKAARYLSKRKK